MKIGHQATMVVNQENDQVLTDLRGYGPLSGVKMSDILPRWPKVQFGPFSAKTIIPGFCVLILLAKRHKPPIQVNLTQSSVIQLKLSKSRYLATENVSWKSVLPRQ